MAENKGNTEEAVQQSDNSKNENGGKDEKKKKTWEEKQEEELKMKKEKFMPFGSDPCVQMRKKGGIPKGELADIKGSRYPWFVKPQKVQDIQKEFDEKHKKEQEKFSKKGEERFKQSNKRLREYLKDKSCEIHKRRIFEANKDPDYDETYEEYLARKDRKRRMKERRKNEEKEQKKAEERDEMEQNEKEEKDETEENKKDEIDKKDQNKKDEKEKNKQNKKDEKEKKDQKEKDENGPPKKKKKRNKEKPTVIECWPGLYVTSATQDYITLLKYIIEAEFETNGGNKRSKRLNTRNNKVAKQFKSFLNVLFTANEMLKDNDASSKKDKRKNGNSDKKPDQADNKPEDTGETSTELKTEDVTETTPEELAAEDEG